MKLRKQDQMTVDDEHQNGIDETTNGASGIHLTNEDKEKGNFQNFNISKQTIKKLESKIKTNSFI